MEYRNDALLWIWLSLACGAASPAAELILPTYGDDLRSLYEADAQTLEELEGLTPAVIQALLDKNLQRAEQILTYCKANGVGLLCPADKAYPARLRAIRACPLLLYYKGTLPDFDRRVCIATVGTRAMTEYGKKTAYTLSFDLARANAVVVSGMAAGIDGMCHRGRWTPRVIRLPF
jgi:DNA processing protein